MANPIKEKLIHEFDNLFPRHTEIQKQFISAAFDAYARRVIEDIIPKQKIFALHHDNPEYSVGQTNGYYMCREDIKKRAEELLGESAPQEDCMAISKQIYE